MSDLERNKAVARRWFIEVVNERRYATCDEIFAPEMEFVDRGARGPAGMAAWVKVFHDGFSDARDVIEDMVAEGDLVVTRVTFIGTHDGPWLGRPPSGKELTWSGVAFQRLRDGKIVRMWAVIDFAKPYRELGLLQA